MRPAIDFALVALLALVAAKVAQALTGMQIP